MFKIDLHNKRKGGIDDDGLIDEEEVEDLEGLDDDDHEGMDEPTNFPNPKTGGPKTGNQGNLDPNQKPTQTPGNVPGNVPGNKLPTTKPPAPVGTLAIKPSYATNVTADADWFQKMNPICKVAIGSKTYQTTGPKNDGKKWKWTETLTHQVLAADDTISVQLFDKDNTAPDHSLGEVKIPLKDIKAKGEIKETPYEWLMGGKKKAGQIYFAFTYTPASPSEF